MIEKILLLLTLQNPNINSSILINQTPKFSLEEALKEEYKEVLIGNNTYYIQVDYKNKTFKIKEKVDQSTAQKTLFTYLASEFLIDTLTKEMKSFSEFSSKIIKEMCESSFEILNNAPNIDPWKDLDLIELYDLPTEYEIQLYKELSEKYPVINPETQELEIGNFFAQIFLSNTDINLIKNKLERKIAKEKLIRDLTDRRRETTKYEIRKDIEESIEDLGESVYHSRSIPKLNMYPASVDPRYFFLIRSLYSLKKLEEIIREINKPEFFNLAKVYKNHKDEILKCIESFYALKQVNDEFGGFDIKFASSRFYSTNDLVENKRYIWFYFVPSGVGYVKSVWNAFVYGLKKGAEIKNKENEVMYEYKTFYHKAFKDFSRIWAGVDWEEIELIENFKKQYGENWKKTLIHYLVPINYFIRKFGGNKIVPFIVPKWLYFPDTLKLQNSVKEKFKILSNLEEEVNKYKLIKN